MPRGRGAEADGRVLRGRRNREAVVDALLALVADGDLNPTATAIAERAGISRRSVFQHFADVESVYQAAVARLAPDVEPLLHPVDVALAVPDRLAALVTRRRHLFTILDPFAKAARLREPISAELRANRQRLTRRMVEQCRQAFRGEVDGDGGETVLLGVAAALSWSLWDHLRSDVGVGDDLAIGVMAGLAARALGLGDLPLARTVAVS